MTHRPDNDQNATKFDRLPVSEMLAVNQWCDRLESAWQPGKGLSVLKELAQQIPVESRELLLPELVLVDIELRLRAGQEISAAEYLTSFRELDPDWLKQQIQDVPQRYWANRRGAGALPQNVGDYEILYELGAGGMGQVFRAKHRIMKRDVAIKMLRSSINNDTAARRRFEREVRAISSLSHVNIVTAFDAREESGTLYLVTEYVDGVSLSRLVHDSGPLDATKAIDYMIQAANGLNFAHGSGIIHRDVKPSNLLVDWSDTLKVLDLGLARWASDTGGRESDETLTSLGQVLGTAHWMSPEQYRAPLTADARSDIYSMGCTLYFLLTGKPPYQGETFVDVIVAHANQPIPKLPLTEMQPFPEKLESLLQSMLAKNPSDRPQSMAHVIDRLGEIRAAMTRAQQMDETVVLSPNKVRISDAALTKTKGEKAGLETHRRRHLAWILLAVLFVAAAALIRSDSFWKTPPAGQAIQFDGVDDYVSVDGFKVVPNGPVMIEAMVVHKQQDLPSHVATWCGPKWLAIFITNDRRLGIAYFDGGMPRLVQSSTFVKLETATMVAGQWTGSALKLFVNGEEVVTEDIEYPMNRTASGLYFGGLPTDSLPKEHGTRYFCGEIFAVRLLMANSLPAPASSLGELLQSTPNTVALFDFRTRPTSDQLESSVVFSDLSKHAWRATLHY